MEEFRRREYRDHGNAFFDSLNPLPPVRVSLEKDVLEQRVPDGMALYSTGAVPLDGRREAHAGVLRLCPPADSLEGQFSFGFSTISALDARQAASAGDWGSPGPGDGCGKILVTVIGRL